MCLNFVSSLERIMSSPTKPLRYNNAPLWSSNGFDSDPFKRKERREARAQKAARKKTEPVAAAPSSELTVLHVFAEGRRKGVMVVPKALRDACGADAAAVMAEISTHAPTYQHNNHTLAASTGLSLTKVGKACEELIAHGYAARVTLTTGEHGKGRTLQTNANGKIVPITKAVRHFAYADTTRASSTQRKKMRRSFAGFGKKGRETRNQRASNLDTILTPSEPGGSGNFSPAPLIMVTQKQMKNKPQTPLADAERGLFNSSFPAGTVLQVFHDEGVTLQVDAIPLPPVTDAEVYHAMVVDPSPAADARHHEHNTRSSLRKDALEAALDTPELKTKYPLAEELEWDVCAYIDHECARQLAEIDATIETQQEDAAAGIPVDPADVPERAVNISHKTWTNWRRCMHIWRQGDLSKPWEMQAALDLHQAPPTAENNIARALLAPRLFFQGCTGHTSRADVVGGSFHGGYQWLSEFTGELNAEDPELGLEEMPRHLTQGDNALLWIQTHRVGLVFLSSVKNPEALTTVQAAKLVRKLRKGTVTVRHIYRLWLLAHFGNKLLTVEEACEVLRQKHGMELNSDEAIEGYRQALRRMKQANLLVMPRNAEGSLDFDVENEGDDTLFATSVAEGTRLLAGFTAAFETFKDVELALRQVSAAGACNEQDHRRLACIWMQAHIDQNERVLDQLRSWGAYARLRTWVSDYAAGRHWLISVGRQWRFEHLPEISQTLGWTSDDVWWLLNELRQYAMRKAWEAFVDIRGCAHTIWSNSLLDRKD
jgi:hypothetical protein